MQPLMFIGNVNANAETMSASDRWKLENTAHLGARNVEVKMAKLYAYKQGNSKDGFTLYTIVVDGKEYKDQTLFQMLDIISNMEENKE